MSKPRQDSPTVIHPQLDVVQEPVSEQPMFQPKIISLGVADAKPNTNYLSASEVQRKADKKNRFKLYFITTIVLTVLGVVGWYLYTILPELYDQLTQFG